MNVGDYVNQKGSDQPTGVIQSINEFGYAKVVWGVADKHIFEDDFHVNDLQQIDHKITSSDEVTKRQAENTRRDISRFSSVEFKSTRKK